MVIRHNEVARRNQKTTTMTCVGDNTTNSLCAPDAIFQETAGQKVGFFVDLLEKLANVFLDLLLLKTCFRGLNFLTDV
jgi:hypothetical protein